MRQFCCRGCRNSFRSKTKNINKKIRKKCIVCNREFESYQSEVYKVCCSSRCKKISKMTKADAKAKKIEPKHVKKPKVLKLEAKIVLVDPTLQNINKAIRHTAEMKKWRKDVFKRDDYTCSKCGEKSVGGKFLHLNAHHMIPLAELIASYPNIEEKSKDDMYNVIHDDFFYDLTNAVTFCEKCHEEWHKKDNMERIWQEKI